MINKRKLLESATKYGKSPYEVHLKSVAEGYVQTKLMYCTKGKVTDITVDTRKEGIVMMKANEIQIPGYLIIEVNIFSGS